jgi:hypothetical protein
MKTAIMRRWGFWRHLLMRKEIDWLILHSEKQTGRG